MRAPRRPFSIQRSLCLCLLLFSLTSVANGQDERDLTISGTRFLRGGEPFAYTGVSFFNAIYNPAFNAGSEQRTEWLEKFKSYGINVLRIWAQWDNTLGFVDTCSECTLYYLDGRLRQDNLARLKSIIEDAGRTDMVVQFVFFSSESRNEESLLAPEAADRAVAAVTRELLPYRNVTFQIWNEFDDRVQDHMRTIKSIDPQRLVSNSPGGGGDLGSYRHNQTLDFLTPHTTRAGRHWEIAPYEIGRLIEIFGKPVVDDEPARTGTRDFGGPTGDNFPHDHILRIYNIWKVGGYVTYHHDMFQTGSGSPAVPPSGIPDPEFSPYHRAVFEFLASRERYRPLSRE